MKVLAVVFACCVGLLGANGSSFAGKDAVERQKLVLDLYVVPLLPSTVATVVKAAGEFSFEKYMDKFEHKNHVEEFLSLYPQEFIEISEPFIPLRSEMTEQAVALYNVLYNVKDFETFFTVSSWARQNINAELFFYVYNIVISQRSDTYNLYVPAMYELFPFYFVPAESMTKANFIQMQQGALNKNGPYYGIEFENNQYTIYSNYTGWYTYVNDEQRLSYYTEDRDLNNLYNEVSNMIPFWSKRYDYNLQSGKENVNHSMGAQFMYAYYQSIVARYYLERLSNGLGEIPAFKYEGPIKAGFDSSLDILRGIPLMTRPNNFIPAHEDLLNAFLYLDDFETYIYQIIQKGHYKDQAGVIHDLRKPEGIDYILKLLFSTEVLPTEEYEYYTIHLRSVLGLAKYVPYEPSVPSALELPYTASRDPLFYQIYNRIVQIVYMFQEYLTPYTVKQLKTSGIQVKDVTVDKLVTYFDYADYPIVGKYLNGFEKFSVNIRQPQLNHAPFAVHFNIHSDETTDVVIKLFMGPKYDSNGRVLSWDENRLNFFEMEKFGYKLKAGENTITRKSEDFSYFGSNEYSFTEMYEKVLTAYNGKKSLDMVFPKIFFSERLMLPKGTKGGYPFQMFVMVYPYVEGENKMNYLDMQGKIGYDSVNYMYPFDRPIEESYFLQPNMYVKEIPVFHYGGESVYQYGTPSFYHSKWYGKDFSEHSAAN